MFLIARIIEAILNGFLLALVEWLLVTVLAKTELAKKPWFRGKKGLSPFIRDGVIVAILYYIFSWVW